MFAQLLFQCKHCGGTCRRTENPAAAVELVCAEDKIPDVHKWSTVTGHVSFHKEDTQIYMAQSLCLKGLTQLFPVRFFRESWKKKSSLLILPKLHFFFCCSKCVILNSQLGYASPHRHLWVILHSGWNIKSIIGGPKAGPFIAEETLQSLAPLFGDAQV